MNSAQMIRGRRALPVVPYRSELPGAVRSATWPPAGKSGGPLLSRVDELAGDGGDVVGVEAGPGQQLATGPGAWHITDGEVRDGQLRPASGDQGVGDGGAEPALGAVVFGQAAGGGGRGRG
jgi:hypothetical protein